MLDKNMLETPQPQPIQINVTAQGFSIIRTLQPGLTLVDTVDRAGFEQMIHLFKEELKKEADMHRVVRNLKRVD